MAVFCAVRDLLTLTGCSRLSDDLSARSGSPCIVTLGLIQQLQLLTVKLRSKHTVLVN